MAAAACSGLSGEPQIVSTLVPATLEPLFPASTPNIAQGAAVFAEHCTRCHGLGGAGDGELVASGEVKDVPNFLDPATAFEQTPSDFFQTITDGRIENLMPPFRDELTSEERWAVALYTYTLAYTPEQIAHGRELFSAECVECHGESGRGDGPKSAELRELPGDLSDATGMVSLGDSAMFVDIHEGIGDTMPAQGIDFGGTWTDADIRSTIAYVRTLALIKGDLVGQPPAQIAEQPEASQEAGTSDALVPSQVRVTGRLTSGTAAGAIPASVDVTLFSFDAEFNQTQVNGTATDGIYAFEDIPYDPNNTYVVTANYRDRVFASGILRGEALTSAVATGALDLPITVYDLTDDSGVIQIKGVVSQVSVVGDGLEVAQVINLTNTSDRAFTSSQMTDDGRALSVVIALPPGAVVASLGGSDNRYIVSEDQSTLIDTAMVLPGEDHVISLVYLIPYGGGAIIEQPLNYAVAGPVRLLVRPLNINVSGDQFPSLGQETVGSTTYASYGADLNLPAGSVLHYELGGTAADAGALERATVPGGNALPVILGIILVLVGVVGITIYVIGVRNLAARRAGEGSAGAAGTTTQIEALAAAIAQLDTDHEAGNIDDADYQTQRAALKARMARLMVQNQEKS